MSEEEQDKGEPRANLGEPEPMTARQLMEAKLPPSNLAKELEGLINRCCREKVSNTPDFILAEYLLKVLKAFEETSLQRENWYGVHLRPSWHPAPDTISKDTISRVFLGLLEFLCQTDREALGQLLEHRVACSLSTAEHPTVQVQSGEEGRYEVGMLGILNSILETLTGKRIGAQFDAESGELLGFSLLLD